MASPVPLASSALLARWAWTALTRQRLERSQHEWVDWRDGWPLETISLVLGLLLLLLSL